MLYVRPNYRLQKTNQWLSNEENEKAKSINEVQVQCRLRIHKVLKSYPSFRYAYFLMIG